MTRPGGLRTCLIYVAVALCAVLAPASSRAEAGVKVLKGPYLQALGPTSVEVRAELDAPGAVSVKITAAGDGGAPRTVRDDAAVTMHVVRIDGLHPATHYAYTLALASSASGGDAGTAKGEFTTAPASDSKAPFSFLVYGDNRTDAASHAAIIRTMLELPSDFVINTGDLVQDGASDANWQSFFDVEAPLIRTRNVFSCVGNHEITDGAGANFLRYLGPTYDARGGGGKPKLYGSFRWADARFFLLDAFESFDSGPERAWLDDELARADAETGLVWRIVVMHQSPWSAGPHGGNPRALRAGIPELFAAHRIDLVLAGHDHIYERGFASGIRYVISGGGGAPLYEIERRLLSTRKVEAVHHVIEATVEGDAVRLETKRADGSVLERCSMTKGREGWDCDPAPGPPNKIETAPNVPPPPAKHGCAVGAARGREPFAPAPAFSALALAALAGSRLRRRRHGC